MEQFDLVSAPVLDWESILVFFEKKKLLKLIFSIKNKKVYHILLLPDLELEMELVLVLDLVSVSICCLFRN